MPIFNIPNNSSANRNRSYLFGAAFELLLVSYDHKTISKNALHSRSETFGPSSLFMYSGCGTYSQATPRLLHLRYRLLAAKCE